MSFPPQEDKELKTTQVAAVVDYVRTKVSPEVCRHCLAHSSSSNAGSQHSGGALVASGVPSQCGSASSGRWRGSRCLFTAVAPLPDGVAQDVRTAVAAPLLLPPLLLLPLLLLLPFLPSWIKTLRAIGLRWFCCKQRRSKAGSACSIDCFGAQEARQASTCNLWQ